MGNKQSSAPDTNPAAATPHDPPPTVLSALPEANLAQTPGDNETKGPGANHAPVETQGVGYQQRPDDYGYYPPRPRRSSSGAREYVEEWRGDDGHESSCGGTVVRDNVVIGDSSKVVIGEGNRGGRRTGGRVTGNRVMR